MSGWRKKLFRVLKFIFGPLGRHFFQTSVTFRDLRILVHSYLNKEQIIYKRKKFFKICGLIRKSWKTFLPAYLCLIYYSVGYKQAQEFFEICGLIRKSRKTPPKTPGVEFIIQFLEEKLKKKSAKFFLRLLYTHKKYILQKKWPKTVNPALSSGVSILPLHIWGCHCQLDDHHRNPNTNNRDHLVG